MKYFSKILILIFTVIITTQAFCDYTLSEKGDAKILLRLYYDKTHNVDNLITFALLTETQQRNQLKIYLQSLKDEVNSNIEAMENEKDEIINNLYQDKTNLENLSF